MLERARKKYHDHIKYASSWDEVVPLLNAKNVIRMPHCGSGDCAEAVKKETAEMCKTADMDPRAPSMGAKGEQRVMLLCTAFDVFGSPLRAFRADRFAGECTLHSPRLWEACYQLHAVRQVLLGQAFEQVDIIVGLPLWAEEN